MICRMCAGVAGGSPNTEGSQPLGIFRPVHVVVTENVRIEPWGLHVWTPGIEEGRGVAAVNVEVRDYAGDGLEGVTVRGEVLDAEGRAIAALGEAEIVSGNANDNAAVFHLESEAIAEPRLWTLEDPYLHYVKAEVLRDGEVVDRLTERFGFRWIQWPVGSAGDGEAERTREVDAVRLAEAAGPENDYFTERRELIFGRMEANPEVRVVPGGVRVMVPEASRERARVVVETEVKNKGTTEPLVIVSHFITNHAGTKFLYSMESEQRVGPGETAVFRHEMPVINLPELWTPENPYLHVVESKVVALEAGERRREWKDQRLDDRTLTTFGIAEGEGLANRGGRVGEGGAEGAGGGSGPAVFA